MIGLILFLAAEVTPVQPLPKGTGLPPPDVDTAAVLAPIDALFAAMRSRDGAAVLAQVRAEGGVTSVAEDGSGRSSLRRVGWAEFSEALKTGTSVLDERITNPAVDIDGDVAMVWSPYVFLIDGKLSHCGVDHFDLVREEGRWRILNVTYSKRSTGCPTP